MSRLRLFLVSLLIALSVLLPVVAAVDAAPSSHTIVTRVTPVPTPTRVHFAYPPGPCPGGGC
jgi:hypothetical protein